LASVQIAAREQDVGEHLRDLRALVRHYAADATGSNYRNPTHRSWCVETADSAGTSSRVDEPEYQASQRFRNIREDLPGDEQS
jgi:hypothetical protein